MSAIIAFMTCAIAYWIGEFVGAKTKAWVPSIVVTATLFLFGYWTFFPKDIVQAAGMGAPFGGTIVIFLLITHIGTTISIKQLLSQWKIIIIALFGLAGMCGACWVVGIPLVGHDYVVCGLPPLTGGLVATNMMQAAAMEKGLTSAALVAVIVFCIQGFFGYPLSSVCIKRESKKLLPGFRNGEDLRGEKVEDAAPKKKLIPPMPQNYITPALIFAKLMVVAQISTIVSGWTGGKVNAAVLTLIFGIIFTQIGFLEENALTKAGAGGLVTFVLMITVFDSLKNATPELLVECIGPVILIIVIGVIGMAILSIAAGKVLHVSWEMAFVTSLTALYGFPSNMILTREATRAIAQNEEEQEYLMDVIFPQMLVGGFVTTTITSVIIAGIFVNFL